MSNNTQFPENSEFSQVRPAPPRGWAYRTGPTDAEYRRRAAEMGVTDLVIAARRQPPAAEEDTETTEDITASPISEADPLPQQTQQQRRPRIHTASSPISEADPLPRQRRPRTHTAWRRPNSRRYMAPVHRRDQQLTRQWLRDQSRSNIAPLLQHMYSLGPIDAVIKFAQQHIINSPRYVQAIECCKIQMQSIQEQFAEQVQQVPMHSKDFETIVNEKYFEQCRNRFETWHELFLCWKVAFGHWLQIVDDHYNYLFSENLTEDGKFFPLADQRYEELHNYVLIIMPRRIRMIFKVIENLE